MSDNVVDFCRRKCGSPSPSSMPHFLIAATYSSTHMVYQEILRSWGYTFESATTKDELVRALTSSSFNGVFLDLPFSIDFGVEVVNLVRFASRRIHCIVVTIDEVPGGCRDVATVYFQRPVTTEKMKLSIDRIREADDSHIDANSVRAKSISVDLIDFAVIEGHLRDGFNKTRLVAVVELALTSIEVAIVQRTAIDLTG